MKILLALWTSLLLIFAGNVSANDDELYDPAPPADSAFVRVLQGASGTASAAATVGGYSYGEVAYPALTKYRVVKQGDYDVKIGSVSAKITIAAGKYYTIALTDEGKIVQLSDELLTNPAKARLYFYNFTDNKASLYAPEFNAAIADGVVKDSQDSQELKAVKLKLQAKVGGAVVKEYPEVQLKRRVGTSVIVTGKAGAYKSVIIENEVER